MRSSLILCTFFGLQAAAFPHVISAIANDMAKRQGLPDPSAAQALSAARTNCGPTPCTVFSATEQYVSTTGQYAYASPAADEIRGEIHMPNT